MTRLIILLDTCVLFPASLRDALLIAAEHHLYDPLWSEDILQELERNLISKKKALKAQVEHLTQAMREGFPAATVSRRDYVDKIDSMVNDPKDRHVVAAAHVEKADAILTFNITDFPGHALLPLHLVAQTPDEFFVRLYAESPEALKAVFIEQASLLRHPPKTYAQLLDTLSLHIPRCVALLQAAASGKLL